MTKAQSGFLTENNIVIGLNAKTQFEAISELSKVLEKNGNISNAEAFTKDVMARESMTTTGIGNNIAIPHGKSASVTNASLVFAKNNYPLEWNSLDGSKVNIIFLMAVSSGDHGNEHLRMLATLSGRLMDDDFVKAIKSENDPKKILEIFNQE
jgi:PTS system fructose-specific IIA component